MFYTFLVCNYLNTSIFLITLYSSIWKNNFNFFALVEHIIKNYDIYYKTKKIKLSPEIIFLLNEKGLGETPFSLYNIFKPALSKEEGWKESKLAGFMFLKIEDEETDLAAGAIEEDVLEGYRLLDTIPL